MSKWPAVKAERLIRALVRIGWTIKRTSGSHRTLARPGSPDYVFAFHDNDEVGPRALAGRQAYGAYARRAVGGILPQ